MGRREPPLVRQGEMLYLHRRHSSMVEEGGQLDRRVSSDPEMILWWRRRFEGEATASLDYVQQ